MLEGASGLVVAYNYLWAREHDGGEETGRKSRPVCVQILFEASMMANEKPMPSLLFPITSQPPMKDRRALAIPEIECRRAGLATPAWIVVDEWNEDDLAASPDLASTKALGRFGAAFVRAIRIAAVEAIRSGQYRRVQRTP
jgi:hypothetical protein